jgi:acyl-CoA hydrolase
LGARNDIGYVKKKISFEDGLSLIKSGSRVVAAMAAAEPRGLLERIGQHCLSLSGVTLYCANPAVDYPCFLNKDLVGRLEIQVMFLNDKVRKLQGQGLVHYVPQHLSQWARNLTRDAEVDIFWGSCTLPDARGFVSIGTGCCYESEMIRKAKTVILEVNPYMPVTSGATHVPTTCVNHFIEYAHPLPTITRPSMASEDHTIAGYVADLVQDGSTIQLGIGGIPNAIGLALNQKNDLGVHTEMINDTMMDLYLEGVITGRKKTLWPGKIVGAFAYGTRELYEFLADNPVIELQPASVVNDPYRISRNYRMVSINSAVEVDITGQVCSESVGHTELSGVGGAWETHIGAQRAHDGRGIIAMRSTTPDGKRSKIAFELLPGAKVSVSRNDVDTIVTEYGVARLLGKSAAARVEAMVEVAHPDFRVELREKARAARYI